MSVIKFYLNRIIKNDHVVLQFNKFKIIYNDPRRFGMFLGSRLKKLIFLITTALIY